MKKQRSCITIVRKRNGYYCNVTGCYGGGYHGAYAGDTAEDAGLFALQQKSRYIDNNLEGGEMYLPTEVWAAIAKERACKLHSLRRGLVAWWRFNESGGLL